MKNEITYTEHNGIYYPDLTLPTQTNYPLGKYAHLRLDYMKKHRRGTYTTLLTEGRLNEYLHGIDIQAHTMLEDIIPHIARERGIFDDELLDKLADMLIEKLNAESSALPILRKQLAEIQKGIDNIVNTISMIFVLMNTMARVTR